MNEELELMPEYEVEIDLEWDTSPPIRPKIVCLCGSTRFREAFDMANKAETFKGHIVLGPGIFPRNANGEWDPTQISVEQKRRLDLLHFRKIELSDEVIVVNVNDYIGESTAREIAYAMKIWKPVKYLYPRKEK